MLKKSILLLHLFSGLLVGAQDLTDIIFTRNSDLQSIVLGDGKTISLKQTEPFFSLVINGQTWISSGLMKTMDQDVWTVYIKPGLEGWLRKTNYDGQGLKYTLTLKNSTNDTIRFENVIPFGDKDDPVYITSTGPWELARAKLFRPGYGPVRVILPDNAWEMGYGSFTVNDELSACSIARRTGYEGSIRSRYHTLIPPGGTIEYVFYIELFCGEWQEGLRRMFHDRWLHDMENFDNSLFERKDLQWIRNAYIIFLQFAWDQHFYSRDQNKYFIIEQLYSGHQLFGGYDVVGIWPTWPRLGLDERNQWDLYRDMPGGIKALQNIALTLKDNNTRFFIAYNPWDESTRIEDPYQALTRLISETTADGVVLDTRGKSSIELQQAADRAREGVIMYSEGMAVPEDMPWIASGRVHDAILYQPELNLNKLIKPEFGIFRVCHIRDGQLHREVAISFLNGLGTEIINFAPGRPAWMEEEFRYLGKTTMILRENTSAFNDPDWTPLIETTYDSIWVNKWKNGNKEIYTIYSLVPQGYSGPLFRADNKPGYHYVSLWHHEEIIPANQDKAAYITVNLDAFNQSWLGTRLEGANECIARFPLLIDAFRQGDSIWIQSEPGDILKVWAGNPGYEGIPCNIMPGKNALSISQVFGDYEDKIVIQLFRNNELADECILTWPFGKPWLISSLTRTESVKKAPEGMIYVTGGKFLFQVEPPDEFIPYPDYKSGLEIDLKSFFIDKYPVTNADYYKFLKETGYLPGDTANYLKHWNQGKYLPGTEHFPVVYVSYEDALAYAGWAGKRLPSEMEWQYAAQGTDDRKWPWGDDFRSEYCNDGRIGLMPVDSWPEGKSPFGVYDLTGNVGQMTGDVYSNGSHRFIIIRGGSFYNPTSSIWYVKGGPQPLNMTQMLLMVSPGFDRCSTVGFRCVKDVELKNHKP